MTVPRLAVAWALGAVAGVLLDAKIGIDRALLATLGAMTLACVVAIGATFRA